MTYITNDYPTSIQTAADPTATDQVATFDHAGLEKFQNDSIDALKTKVGVDSSAVTSSHDYKLSEVISGDKSAGKTATQTLTNKTLTAPKIVTGGFIADENGNEQIEFATTASAVNHVKVTNAATGNGPTVESTGNDSNVDLNVKGKGTGKVKLGTAGLKFPNSDGSANEVLKTDGSGVLSFGAVTGLISSVVEDTTGTYSLTTIAGQRVIVFARAVSPTSGAADVTYTLTYNGVTKDSVTIRTRDGSGKDVFSLMYTEIPGAGTANVVISGGTDPKMIIIKF